MKVTEEVKKKHLNMAKIFFYDTVEDCQKEGKTASEVVEMLHKQVMMCQTLLFCFMADVCREDSTASVYGEMRGMSLEALALLTDNPDVFLSFSESNKRPPRQAMLDIVELFREIGNS